MKTITVTKADYDASVAAHDGDANEAFRDNEGCEMCAAIKKRMPHSKISVVPTGVYIDGGYIKFKKYFGSSAFQQIGLTGKSFTTTLIPV